MLRHLRRHIAVSSLIAVSCEKTAEPIEMPFRLYSDEPREAYIRWGPDTPCEGAIFRGEDMRDDTVVSYAKRLNRPRCHLGCGLGRAHEIMGRGFRFHYAKEQFLGEWACAGMLKTLR